MNCLQFAFVSELKDTLPLLEALFLSIKYFIIRPKRRDYPTDDGIDEIEHDCAVKIFSIHPGLRFLSLTGTSLPDQVPQISPSTSTRKPRVWVKEIGENDELGARLAEGTVDIPGGVSDT